MGERSKVEGLPGEVRESLDKKLFEGNFSGYVSLAEWLSGQGYEISKSSLHRYGSRLEERMAQLKRSTEMAKALVAASPDDAGDMTEATMRLMQEKIFTLLMEVDIDPEDADLGKIAKALAPLARAQIALKRFAAEVREKTEAAVEELVQAQGMTADQAKFWREKFLGVVKA